MRKASSSLIIQQAFCVAGAEPSPWASSLVGAFSPSSAALVSTGPVFLRNLRREIRKTTVRCSGACHAFETAFREDGVACMGELGLVLGLLLR